MGVEAILSLKIFNYTIFSYEKDFFPDKPSCPVRDLTPPKMKIGRKLPQPYS
jgi:hypothetical protein